MVGSKTPSRRGLMKVLIAAGIPAPVALNLLAQSRTQISADTLRQASAILGQSFSEERLNAIQPALQRNLDQYQGLRDFELDDLVEPAPVFLPLRHAQVPRG